MLYASVDWVVLIGLAFLMVAALNVVNPSFRTSPTPDYVSPSLRAHVGNCVRHDETGKNCATTLLCSSYVKSSGRPAWKCDQVASEN